MLKFEHGMPVLLLTTLIALLGATSADASSPSAKPRHQPAVSDVGLPIFTSINVRGKSLSNRVIARDIYMFGGVDFDRWPYIEHSGPDGDGIQGMNFMLPNNSTYGWRFITRISEPNLTVRATIFASGDAMFQGTVRSAGLQVGTPGLYTPAALAWGNHLGGDFRSTLFSSASISVQGVAASVFGISYSGIPVFAQNAYGNVGIYGDVAAKNVTAVASVSANSVYVNGTAITSGNGSPALGCAVGDLYARKDGRAGSTLYTCTSPNKWNAVSVSP